jgi:hypothetical protein
VGDGVARTIGADQPTGPDSRQICATPSAERAVFRRF